jgi:hypothetical protein
MRRLMGDALRDEPAIVFYICLNMSSDVGDEVIMGGDDALYVYGGESSIGGWLTAQLSHRQGWLSWPW